MEKYNRNNEILDGNLDGSLVMMDIQKGKYFSLNPVGKRIWELIEQPKSFDEITDSLQAEFEVTPEQCRSEVIEFLAKMEKSGIIKRE
ncbi:MAG: PqqD family peptide modification chaperone [Mariniphaga sp.]